MGARTRHSGERRSAFPPPPHLPPRSLRSGSAGRLGTTPRRPHAIGRADATGGALGFWGLTRAARLLAGPGPDSLATERRRSVRESTPPRSRPHPARAPSLHFLRRRVAGYHGAAIRRDLGRDCHAWFFGNRRSKLRRKVPSDGDSEGDSAEKTSSCRRLPRCSSPRNLPSQRSAEPWT